MDLEEFNLADGDSGDQESSLDDLLASLSESDSQDEASQSPTGDANDQSATPDQGFEWLSDDAREDIQDPIEAAYDANHVLALSPLQRDVTDDICHDLCTPVPTSDLDVLFISLTRTSEEVLEHWESHEPTLPANLSVLCTGDQARSTTSSEFVSGPSPRRVTVKSIPDPSDLTRLGITVVNLLSDWQDTGNQPVVCLHSLTAFLQYVEPERLFRFLHLLQARIDRIDGFAHYHMDPTAHPPETIGTFHTLFDTIVRVDDDGTPTVEHD